jgi:hypothetical protein
MIAYFRTSNKTRAYLEVCPGVTEESAGSLGPRFFGKITARVPWPQLLALAGLDDARLANELAKKLEAKKSEFYQGEEVAVVDDNGTQMRAVELLADLLGKRKTDITLNTQPAEGLTLVLSGAKDLPPEEVES